MGRSLVRFAIRMGQFGTEFRKSSCRVPNHKGTKVDILGGTKEGVHAARTEPVSQHDMTIGLGPSGYRPTLILGRVDEPDPAPDTGRPVMPLTTWTDRFTHFAPDHEDTVRLFVDQIRRRRQPPSSASAPRSC